MSIKDEEQKEFVPKLEAWLVEQRKKLRYGRVISKDSSKNLLKGKKKSEINNGTTESFTSLCRRKEEES